MPQAQSNVVRPPWLDILRILCPGPQSAPVALPCDEDEDQDDKNKDRPTWFVKAS
jgi:hypothetical protein